MNIYIGIDPGSAGGIAVVNADGDVFGVYKMPDTGKDCIDLLLSLPGARAVVEKVNPGVFGHGKAGRMGVVSAFTFGRNVERVQMALLAAGIPFDEVLPVKWQTALGCRTGGDKNVSKARAQALFPDVKVTHAVADALLIAEFCRRINRGSDGKEEEGRAQAGARVLRGEGARAQREEERREEAKPQGGRQRPRQRTAPA